MPEDEVEAAHAPADAEQAAEDEGEGEEGPVVPSHEPFEFKVLRLAQAQQSANGLRHNDHLRYRQYCTRRLRRLYNVLRFKHGKGRYKPAPFPADFADVRYLEVLLVCAERAWSYGVQLKADNAAASALNPRWRHRCIRRLAKSVYWAQKLESVCKVHADQRTQLEAEAYAALLEGTWLLEKEEWQEALTKIQRCKRLSEHLGLAAGEDSALFKTKVQELQPMLRECKYNLGMGYGEGEEDEVKTSGKQQRRDLSELSYRGHGLAIPSEKLKSKLLKCIQLVSTMQVSETDESAEVIEKYGGLSAEFADALKDIHSDMIAAGADGQTDEWRMLEAFAREMSLCMGTERNLVLLRNHLAKLSGMQEVSSHDARKTFRPEEGMRFCDMLKADLADIHELPETSEAMADILTAYSSLAQNCRTLFLACCHMSTGKLPEAAALMDMLHGRVSEVNLGDPLEEPLGRLHAVFDGLQTDLPSLVAKWRCRVLAQLATEAIQAKKEEASGQAPTSKGADFGDLGSFPPKIRDIPCKPLLFDLAFPCIQPPDLEQMVRKEGQQKGRLAAVAGGVLAGVRGLGGFLGRGGQK